MSSCVALVRCSSYEPDEVYSAVKRGLELTGGIDSSFSNGESILLKPNMLSPSPPEKCATTHPGVFGAVAGILKKRGFDLSYGESPGFGDPVRIAKKCGIAAAAADLNIRYADFSSGKGVLFESGYSKRSFTLAHGVTDSDALLNICKLKTHGLTRLTGAVKNIYGCLNGLQKAGFHAKYPHANDFSRFVIDLNLYIKPRLHIMDGIISMEGNGPNSGTPKKTGVLLFSRDPVALDTVASVIIGLDPENVPTTVIGNKRGLGTSDLGSIEIRGDSLDDCKCSDFRVVNKPAVSAASKGIKGVIQRSMQPGPVIEESECIKCRKCIQICPVEPKALSQKSKDSVPEYNYSRCIRCYCCQESCPVGAIRIKDQVSTRFYTMLTGIFSSIFIGLVRLFTPSPYKRED
ncbi:MAG: DUF362 domain-containing protein [Chitinivibrionales bacterium]